MTRPVDDQHSQRDVYGQTVVDVTLGDGRTVSLRVGERPPPELELPFVVLTAWNPASRVRAAWVNAVDQALLEGILKTQGCDTLSAVGRAPDGSWSEPSVAVWGLAADDAVALGGDFGQHAIFAVAEAGLQVLWCPVPEDGPPTP